MKKTKRILVFAILAAMLLSLCGCGMFRTRVAKAAIKMSKLESLHADVEVQLGMGISLLGQDVNVDTSVTGGADIQRALLEADGIEFTEDGRVDMEKYGWTGLG